MFAVRGARRFVQVERGRPLHRPGLSMVCAGEMHLPSTYRAKHKRGPLAVARGDVAGPILRAERDGLLTGTAASPLILAGHSVPSLQKRIADSCPRTAKKAPSSRQDRRAAAQASRLMVSMRIPAVASGNRLSPEHAIDEPRLDPAWNKGSPRPSSRPLSSPFRPCGARSDPWSL